MIVVLAIAAATASARVPDALAVQAIHNFGACVVAETPQGARQLLALDYNTPKYKDKIRAIAKGHADRCDLSWWRLSFNPVLFAGAMAEALVKSETNQARLPQQLAFDPNRQNIIARSPLELMALCTSLQAPAQTANLLETEPATADEARSFEALHPALENCVPKDKKVVLNGPGLRSLLALAAYRILSTPQKVTP